MGCDCSGNLNTIAQNVAAAGHDVCNEGTLDETHYGLKLTGEAVAGTETSNGKSGMHGAPAPVRFCHWAAPEYGSEGESLWNYLFQAAQLAIAILLASVQAEIADLNEELAESYYDMAEDKWKRFKEKYVPLENALLEEVSNVDEPEMDCDDDRSRAEEAVNLSYDYIDKFISARAKMYRMCLDDTDVAVLNFGRNLMLVDTENYNLREDTWFVDFKSDQRWKRRSDVLNLGRNLSGKATEYGDMARAMLKDIGGLVDKAGGQLMHQLGYYGTRFDTYYSTGYLASAGNIGTGTGSTVSMGSSPTGGVRY